MQGTFVGAVYVFLGSVREGLAQCIQDGCVSVSGSRLIRNTRNTIMRKLCVYCGSSGGNRPEYAAVCRQLADAMMRERIDLVYGGGSVGMMGSIADAVIEGGGQVIGVIPRFMVDKELMHPGISEAHIVDSMHQRKTIMAEFADGFIALPGGVGTMEELFEVWTWRVLKLHQKPCALLNVGGYYDSLVSFIDGMVDNGFLKPKFREMLIVDDDPDRIIDRMQEIGPSSDEVGRLDDLWARS